MSDLWLKHYASKYYDPVKAHEYYMKTRELKGRRQSSARLNAEGKKIWDYTKNSISTEHKNRKKRLTEEIKNERKQAASEYKKQVNELNDRAKKMRADIESKVAQWKKLYENSNDKKMIINQMAPILRKLRADMMEAKLQYGNRSQDISNKSLLESKNISTEYDNIRETEYQKILKEYATPAKAKGAKRGRKARRK